MQILPVFIVTIVGPTFGATQLYRSATTCTDVSLVNAHTYTIVTVIEKGIVHVVRNHWVDLLLRTEFNLVFRVRGRVGSKTQEYFIDKSKSAS